MLALQHFEKIFTAETEPERLAVAISEKCENLSHFFLYPFRAFWSQVAIEK